MSDARREFDPPVHAAAAGAAAGPRDNQAEPERYELREPVHYSFDFSRREFLSAAGAGVVVLVALQSGLAAAQRGVGSAQSQQASQIGAWLHIAEDGAVTVYTGKVEIGQDIRTSLAQHVAEELRIAPSRIKLVMADTDLTPFDQGTFGSRSTPLMGPQLRRAAAAARALLLGMAAERWSTDAGELALADGRVTDGRGGRSATIGELTRGQRLVQSIGAATPLTPAPEWKVIGTELAKVNGADIVTGRHRYTVDLRLPGMLTGAVLRAPAIGARLTSLDSGNAAAMQGVVVVHDGDFAGVAAPDELSATRARAALRAQWSEARMPSHREIFEHLRSTAQRGTPNERGSVEAGMREADVRLEAAYTAPYIAHVPLEPRAAVAQWENGKLTVWTGTQRPWGVRGELAAAFRLPEDQVRVVVPDTGSAYGGKHTGECAIEAARLARAANRPVKLVWSREEEFTWAYFRPAALIEIQSGVRRDGTITAWSLTNYNSGASGIASPYNVANHRTTFLQAQSPLRQGSYRALAATANNFARETHMDELAASVGRDPLDFRLHNLRDSRLRAVLEAAASSFGWSAWSATAGRGVGIACGTEKGGYVATCAEVQVDRSSGETRVLRITAAFECGAVVNPDGLRQQVEGCLVMGLGGALWEAIEFENGRILNARVSEYRVPRMRDVPPIDIVLVDRRDLPSAGAGEAPIVALAPALGGAIYRATGSRLRSLPLAANGVAMQGSG